MNALRDRRKRFVLLRDESGWPRSHAGLDTDASGDLLLARVPGALEHAYLIVPGPYDRMPALEAFAVGAHGEIVLALRAQRELVVIDGACNGRRFKLRWDEWCRGDVALQSVSGLAAGRNTLYVADEVGARVLAFTLPALELRWVLHAPFRAPKRLGLDAEGRLYVLDVERKRIVRLTPDGQVDGSYDTDVVPELAHAIDLFVTASGAAFVTIDGDSAIRRFSAVGATQAELPPPATASTLQPGAIAGDARCLYVADRASGAIWVYAVESRQWIAPMVGVRAPITGLATDGTSNLYMRSGNDDAYTRLDASAGYVASGVLEVGPFDAGEHCVWTRVHADAGASSSTHLVLEIALAGRADPQLPPVWRSVPGLDALVRPLSPPGAPPDPDARFAWVRVRMEADDIEQSPRLRQLTLETTGDDYLARLPAVYARRDAETGSFLRALLASFHGQLGDVETEIAALARRVDPATAPEPTLEWLASWMAFDLPPNADASARRSLLLDAHRIYARRGTLDGLREMVRIYTGVDCDIDESFRSRRLWALGGSARLGFDTGLLPGLPDGMIVPAPTPPSPGSAGLAEQYFWGDALADPAGTLAQGGDGCAPREAAPMRIEPDGSFPFFAVPSVPKNRVVTGFSVRWSGQVRALYSELYAFHFAHEGGARVFIDDDLLIDTWTAPGSREPVGHVPLVAGHWYDLRIEYWADSLTVARPRLSWSSRSLRKQIVPGECLYAGDDAEVHSTRDAADRLVVGETVVGAHGPATPEDFGASLFAEAAHLFTVRVAAHSVRGQAQLDAVRAVLDAEKPAHTDYHLCVLAPTFIVGTQASVGVDAFVSAPPPDGRFDEDRLGVDSRLGISPEHSDRALRVDESIRIGTNAILR